jgi:BirA family transcriptional regulator, biotin operon repressor / biotin---[acetyl-CoA-carboxylase] ligase
VTDAQFFSRQERFAAVGSTNDVVRDWLSAGTPEVCLALADEQTAGRGRDGRTWVAPAGTSLLLSLGFRPSWLEADQVWRLAAIVSLAMADAAEEAAGLPDGLIQLKWPNDLVAELATKLATKPEAAATSHTSAAAAALAATASAAESPWQPIRKLAGVLGETDGLGTADPRVVIGLGLNVDWAAADVPAELTGRMTSLREASGGRPVDPVTLLDAFLSRLEPRVLALRGGRFPIADWTERQLTTGRIVDLRLPDGRTQTVRALGVDARSGGLVIEDPATAAGERTVLSGEIHHLRVAAQGAEFAASLAGRM